MKCSRCEGKGKIGAFRFCSRCQGTGRLRKPAKTESPTNAPFKFPSKRPEFDLVEADEELDRESTP